MLTTTLQADPPPGFTPDTNDPAEFHATLLVLMLFWTAVCYRIYRGPRRR